MDDRTRGAGPFRDGRDRSAKRRVVNFVDEDAKESGGLFARIWLQLLVYIDDKSRRHGREQTSLRLPSRRMLQFLARDLRILEWCSDLPRAFS